MKDKSNINKFLVIIILVLVCIVITAVLIIAKVRELNLKYNMSRLDYMFYEKKDKDLDTVYIPDENTTYFFNDIEFKYWFDIDGDVFDESRAKNIDSQKYYQYIEISGLKDKDIQNKINQEIKECVYSITKTDENDVIAVSTRVVGNFSNVLSILVTDNDTTYIGLNYDLNTGNQISFEDMFIKSTPIKSILADSACELYAWNADVPEYNPDDSYDEYCKKVEETYNMDNRDMSDCEQVLLEVSNVYEENKGNIIYTVTPFRIEVYNLTSNLFKKDNNILSIDMRKYSQYVAVYKRFLNSKNIYENPDLKLEGIRAFSMPMNYFNQYSKNAIYGNLSDNLFCDIYLYANVNNDIADKEQILNYCNTNVNNIINELKQKSQQDKAYGYVIQGTLSGFYDEGKYVNYQTQKYLIPHISMKFSYTVTKIPIEKYKNLNDYLAELATRPTASPDPLKFEEQYKSDYPDFDITTNFMDWYFDVNSNYLGDSLDLLIDYDRN